jgi:hypothetical protein
MSNLEKRWLTAKDFLKNPSILDSYLHKYVLLLDQSSLGVSYKNLLMAIEQMENQGWMLHNITYSGNARGMYALMCRKQ